MSDGLKFIKDTSFLSIWNVISVIIGLFSFYIITNSLGPTEYGKYALAFSIISTINLSIYVSVNETLLRFSAVTKDKRMLLLCMKIQLIFGILAVIGLSVFSLFAEKVYNKPIGTILFILALSFLFTPVIESVKSFSIGRKNVKDFISLTRFNQIVLLAFIATLAFFGIRTAFAFSAAYITVSFFSFAYALHIVKKEKYEDDSKYNKQDVINYIKGGMIFGIFKNIYYQSAGFIGSRFVDITSVAYFTFSMSIITATIVAFEQTIQMLTIPYVTNFYENKESEKCSRYLNASVKFGLMVSVCIAVVIYIFMKLTINYLFLKYVGVMPIIPYILFAAVLINFALPLSFLKAKGKMNILVKISVVSAIFSLTSSYVLPKLFGLNGMILSLIANIIVLSLMAWYYSFKEMNVKFTIIPSKEEIGVFVNFAKILLGKIKIFTAKSA